MQTAYNQLDHTKKKLEGGKDLFGQPFSGPPAWMATISMNINRT